MLILMIPTMRCNLACAYCHFKPHKGGFFGYGTDHQFVRDELEWFEWIRFLDRFRPYKLEITGGEPLMWKGFKKFIAHLPFDARWAITSNTLLDVTGIDLSKCDAWTGSFHYGESESFLDNLKRLQQAKNPRVNLVAEKNGIGRCITMVKYFAGEGFGVNILRELNLGVDWRDSDEWATLKKVAATYNCNLVESDIPPAFEFESGFNCLAGVNYFCAMPDGMTYRCYSHAMKNEPMGLIENVEPLKGSADCNVPCLGCAKDFEAQKVKSI